MTLPLAEMEGPRRGREAAGKAVRDASSVLSGNLSCLNPKAL